MRMYTIPCAAWQIDMLTNALGLTSVANALGEKMVRSPPLVIGSWLEPLVTLQDEAEDKLAAAVQKAATAGLSVCRIIFPTLVPYPEPCIVSQAAVKAAARAKTVMSGEAFGEFHYQLLWYLTSQAFSDRRGSVGRIVSQCTQRSTASGPAACSCCGLRVGRPHPRWPLHGTGCSCHGGSQ
jgi:hypothetical protein